MVGRFIAWLLRCAGYDLTQAATLTQAKREFDDVLCDLQERVGALERLDKPVPLPAKEDKPDAATIMREYLYGASGGNGR